MHARCLIICQQDRICLTFFSCFIKFSKKKIDRSVYFTYLCFMKKKTGDPKQRLLDTATALFYNQGYHATGINQVIEEAGVARASLYLHYESKESLLLAF
ncbi:TetR/AcrR family transcriptional regulator, partial [Chitinophaga sp.]|uniref:TetR/AcrR family transcriptional regulator n=1 Tax=Chitinophaga sp. TaxID=1869181 RepID=UPI0039C8A6D9